MPGWFPLILGSAVALGCYDFCKKTAVQGNRVMPVLFWATLTGSGALVILSVASGHFLEHLACGWRVWLMILLKSCIVASSWIAGYYALHDLPISIASPVRASSPVWATIGGAVLLREIPSPLQALAMAIIFAGYFTFSVIGKAEGLSWRCRGIRMVVAATLLGASSALYDRFLMHVMQLNPNVVQLHFSINLVAIIGLCWLLQPHCRMLHEEGAFQWRWAIPAIGVLLIIADWLYFNAVTYPDAQIGMIAVLRRLSVCVSFLCGACFLKEQNLLRKSGALLLILAGVLLLAWAKR